MSAEFTSNWYIAFTRPMAERKVAEQLTKKSIEHFIPYNRVFRPGMDQIAATIKPLFPSFVFVKVEAGSEEKLRKVKGISNIMNWQSSPAVLRTEDVDALRRFMETHVNISLEKIRVNPAEAHSLIHSHTPVLQQDGETIEVLAPSSSRLNLPGLGFALISQSQKEFTHPKNVIMPASRNIFTRVRDMVG